MRRIVVFLLGGLLFTATSGCTKSVELPTDSVFIGIQSAPATLDPRFAKDAIGMRIGNLLFQSFVRVGPDLEIVGDAAKTWEWQGNTLVMHLREDIQFGNGRPLEKQDILYSIQEYQKPSNPFHSSLDLLESAEVEQKGSTFIVKLKMKEFSAKLLAADLPMLRLLPAKEILNSEETFKSKPMGTGNFDLVSLSNNLIELKARKHHPVAVAKVNNVVFKVVKNNFTLYQKLLKGEIDLVQSDLPLSKITVFEQKPDEFQVFKTPGLSFSYLLINHRDPLLKNKALRQAIDLAIDRDEIIKYKLETLAIPATSLMTPANPFHDPSLIRTNYDVNKAQELLDHKKIQLSLKTSNSRQAVENGKVLAAQLKKAGIEVDLQSFEWGTFFSDVQKGRFQMATMRWVGAIDPDLYRMAYHSSELPPGRNRGAYRNLELDSLLDQGLVIRDIQKRIQHYYKVQQIVFEDLVVIPLWYDQQVSVVSRRIKNYTPSKNGDFSPVLHLDILKK